MKNVRRTTRQQTEYGMSTNKKKLAVPRDLAIESYPKPEIKWEPKWRVSPAVIDAPSSARIYVPPMHYDAFLNYLEWKMDRPWYKRLFLP